MEKGYTKTALRELGFSDKLIKELLPEPRLVRNPVYRSSSPMQIWEKEDVEKAVNTERFREWLVGREKRRKAAADAAETKRDKFLKELELRIGEIEIPVLSKKDLYRESLESKRAWEYAHGNFDFYGEAADEATRNRWAVNYIRHELTDYERVLYEIKGCVGVGEAYEKYKASVTERIYEIYPFLKTERTV